MTEKSQNCYRLWYYGTVAKYGLQDKYPNSSLLIYKFDLLQKEGKDLSSLTVRDIDKMAFDNEAVMFKVNTTAVAIFGVTSEINSAKSYNTSLSSLEAEAGLVSEMSSTSKTATKAVSSVSVADEIIEGGLDDVNLKINIGQQNKHIQGTNNYKQELANGKLKSILSADPQELLDDFAGTGQKIGTNKERVDFGNVIGKYVNSETGEVVDTTVGIIHYGKNGAHIVPARPK